MAVPTEHGHTNSAAVPDPGTRMALARTGMAADRTLMAWIRTSFSMISFGFTIAKFFQYLRAQAVPGLRPTGGRTLGLLLITLGLTSLILGAWEYRRLIARLEQTTGARHRVRSILVVTVLVALLGIVAFLDVFVRLDIV